MPKIVADTSVFVALFKREPVTPDLRYHISKATSILIPSICLVEMALLRRIDDNIFDWASELLRQQPYELIAVSLAESSLAAEAARRYGKGSGHPAQLNFGDCLVYAAAKSRGLPLLFTRRDFARTDIVSALVTK